MNALATIKTPQHDKDYAVQIMRTISARLGLIREEVNQIGLAVTQGRIRPDIGLTLVEQIAPGCADAVALAAFEGVSPDQLRDFTNDVAK
jgi:hypothetical protein